MSDKSKKGWWVVAVGLLLPTAITWLYFVALRNAPAAMQQAAYMVGKCLQFSLPVWWVWRSRREDMAWPQAPVRGVGLGIALGCLVAAAMGILYVAWLAPSGFFVGPGEQIRSKVLGMGLDTPWKYAVVGVFYSLCHSGLEEYYWRWFVHRELTRRIAPGWATILSSLGFMAHHVLVLAMYFGWLSLATWLFSAGVAIGGAAWAWLYDRSGSLLGAWASHCLVDAAIFLIGYDLVRTLWNL